MLQAQWTSLAAGPAPYKATVATVLSAVCIKIAWILGQVLEAQTGCLKPYLHSFKELLLQLCCLLCCAGRHAGEDGRGWGQAAAEPLRGLGDTHVSDGAP